MAMSPSPSQAASGPLTLSRQVCPHLATQTHVMPGNAVLAPHKASLLPAAYRSGPVCCLRSCPLSPSPACSAGRPTMLTILSDTTVRNLVRMHGQIIRRAEQAEVTALATRNDLARLDLNVVPHGQPRRHAGWPAELNAAVDAALAREQVHPPEGVSWADWERVLAARRAEATCPIEELRHLGPALEPNQVLVTVDEVLTRKPEAGRFLELRTARLMTEQAPAT